MSSDSLDSKEEDCGDPKASGCKFALKIKYWTRLKQQLCGSHWDILQRFISWNTLTLKSAINCPGNVQMTFSSRLFDFKITSFYTTIKKRREVVFFSYRAAESLF